MVFRKLAARHFPPRLRSSASGQVYSRLRSHHEHLSFLLDELRRLVLVANHAHAHAAIMKLHAASPAEHDRQTESNMRWKAEKALNDLTQSWRLVYGFTEAAGKAADSARLVVAHSMDG
jgi:hypothetical protein